MKLWIRGDYELNLWARYLRWVDWRSWTVGVTYDRHRFLNERTLSLHLLPFRVGLEVSWDWLAKSSEIEDRDDREWEDTMGLPRGSLRSVDDEESGLA